MPSHIHILRGPVLNCTRDSRSPNALNSPTYIKDALIILQEGNIIEFGHAEKLKHNMPNKIPVKFHRTCRIINTVING